MSTLEVTMTPMANRSEVEYVRNVREAPSSVSTFAIRAVSAINAPGKAWEGQVSKPLDDVNGSRSVKLQWGPVRVAGEHVVEVQCWRRAE